MNTMTASELRNEGVARSAGSYHPSCPVTPTVCGFVDQRLKLGEDGTGPIDWDTGSDKASITNA